MKSLAGVARYCNISYPTARGYAKLHGILDELKNPSGKGIRKLRHTEIDLKGILEGRQCYDDKYYLKLLLIKECILPEECNKCGYNERRRLDKTVPLLLDFINGNEKNQRRENLRLLCPNCYFLERQEKKVHQILKEYERQLPPAVVWH